MQLQLIPLLASVTCHCAASNVPETERIKRESKSLHRYYPILYNFKNILLVIVMDLLVYFIIRPFIIYLTACSIILTRILVTSLTFLIHFNDSMSSLLIVKCFELDMDLALNIVPGLG